MSERDAEDDLRAQRLFALMDEILGVVDKHTQAHIADGATAVIAASQATGIIAATVAKPGHLPSLLETIERSVRESAEIHLAERARQQ